MSKWKVAVAAAGVLAGCASDGATQRGMGEGDAGDDPSVGPDGETSDGSPGEDGSGGSPDGSAPAPDGSLANDGGLGDAGPYANDPTFTPETLPGLSAGCVGVRYASTSDRIYVEGAGSVCSPRDIALTIQMLKTPPAQGRGLFAVDELRGIYYLGSNLFIQDGAKLDVRGIGVGGDTNELRLKSLNSADPGSFVYIRAEHGDINFEGTRVRSWDDAVQGPDVEYEVFGRAFVGVRSWLDPDGVTPHESRMDVNGSEISYLGYYAAEAYGLVWKVSGEAVTPSGASLYDLVNVYGDIVNSNIHHNYFGVYTYGAYGVKWDNNDVHHNIQYGLDPHDDSDTLLITNNFVHENGNHGIICSRRCDKLLIANNVSNKNTGVGIFLHGFVTDSVVEDNEANDNGNAGVALFDSHHNTIRRNTLLRNQYGVRLSVGSSHNTFEANDIGFATKYAIYFYQGTDLPVEGDGRPKFNLFVANNVHDGAQALKMGDADDNTFRGNTFGTFFNRHVHVGTSHRTLFDDNLFPVDDLPIFRVEGTVDIPSVLTITRHGPLTLAVVGQGTGVIASDEGQIYSSLFPTGMVVDASGSKLTVTNSSAANLSGDVSPLPFFVSPADPGTSASIRAGAWAVNRAWTVTPISPAASMRYRIGELPEGTCYLVKREGANLTTLAVDDEGALEFTDTPRPSGSTSYVLSPVNCP